MATMRPFKAVRPARLYAEKVIALPYDVMNRNEAADMVDGNPYSFLHISRSEIDMPEQENPYDMCVYERAKANLAQFSEDGVLIEDEEPSFYIYKQTMEGREQVGIVGCVSVDEYLNNTIKKHEYTRVEKEIDRINHFDVCNANTEPIFLTYRDNMKLRSIMHGWISTHDAEYDITTKDGVIHQLWVMDDKSIMTAISEMFEDIPYLYIADGHHRSASACKVGLKRRSEKPDYTGEEEFNFFMAVAFPDKDLNVFDYNRVVKDLNGSTADEFIKKIEKAGFAVIPVEGQYEFERKHTFGMYLEEKWYKLEAQKAIIPDDVIGSLDVSILQNNVLEPLLAIKDPRTDKRIDFVGGIRGMKELERRTKEDMTVAFAVYPVDVDDLLAVADNDMVMPPKSTWFEPKLGSGLFVHKL